MTMIEKIPISAKLIGGGGLGGALIADGMLNASTGPIVAGMVTIIGTAAVVVFGQLMAARNKAYAEQRAIDLAAEVNERAALLRDYQQDKDKDRARIDQLQERLIDAERRAANTRNLADVPTPRITRVDPPA